MSLGPALDTLAARWADAPHPTVCAALADGLRKRGDLRGAAALLERGTDRFPGHVPLWITQARTALELDQAGTAEAALAKALAIDPDHPVARELAAEFAPALLTPLPESETLVFAEPVPEGSADEEVEGAAGAALVTESLAALYHRQGHLELALAAYAELAARDPANTSVAARHEAVRREVAATRPLPFDARESGGIPAATWLGRLAARTPAPRPRAEYDAFFDPPPAPTEATTDFDAFQRWLQELDR